MACRQHVGAQIPGHRHQVNKLDRLVAGDAWHGRFALLIGIGERRDHALFEALFIIEHVMGNIKRRRHPARIVNILPGATGALAMGGLTMIVELQRDADDVITLLGQQARHDRGIHATRHRDNNARVLRALGNIKRVHFCPVSGWVQGPADQILVAARYSFRPLPATIARQHLPSRPVLLPGPRPRILYNHLTNQGFLCKIRLGKALALIRVDWSIFCEPLSWHLISPLPPNRQRAPRPPSRSATPIERKPTTVPPIPLPPCSAGRARPSAVQLLARSPNRTRTRSSTCCRVSARARAMPRIPTPSLHSRTAPRLFRPLPRPRRC